MRQKKDCKEKWRRQEGAVKIQAAWPLSLYPSVRFCRKALFCVCVCVCAYKHMCMFRHLKRCWAVHLLKTFHLSRPPPNPLAYFHQIPFLLSAFLNSPLSHFHVVLLFACGEAGIISYTWHGAWCGTTVMQASVQGFCVQKIQLKNNYQKISGSPVRL